MPNPLIVTGEATVALDGSIDSSNDLQVEHDQDSLDDYLQSLHAKHEILESPSRTIRVKIVDFSSGGDNWTTSVTHLEEGTSITWSRDTDYAYDDFAAMTDALEVDVTVTSDASPPQSKTRKIWIKTMPADGQPDRP